MSLYDLAPFAGLEAVAREFHVRFRLYGGTASRLWMRRELGFPDATLAELAPYASDINLDHDGDDALTPAILAAIDELVPGAVWCRWSLLGRAAAAAQARRKAASTRIPLRDVSFGPYTSFQGGDQALGDLLDGDVSAYPSEQLSDSPDDLEIFGLMVAFNAAADLMNLTGEPVSMDAATVNGFLERYRDRKEDARLRTEPRLQRRARHLIASLCARVWPLPEGMAPVLSSLVSAATHVPLPDRQNAALVSATLESGGDLPAVSVGLDVDRVSDLSAMLEESGFRLDPVFSVRALSASVTLAGAETPSSGTDPWGGGREFLHLAWLGDAPAGALGGLALGFRNGVVESAGRGASAGGRFPLGANWLRLDVGDLAPAGVTAEVRVAILEAAIPEEDIAPETPRSRSGGSGDEAVIEEARPAQEVDEGGGWAWAEQDDDDEHFVVVES